MGLLLGGSGAEERDKSKKQSDTERIRGEATQTLPF